MTNKTAKITLGIVGLIIVLAIAGIIKGGIQQTEKYNNGIHAEDEGHWIITSVAENTYICTCDHCHEQLEVWKFILWE
jgi:hypothetical protein